MNSMGHSLGHSMATAAELGSPEGPGAANDPEFILKQGDQLQAVKVKRACTIKHCANKNGRGASFYDGQQTGNEEVGRHLV